MQRKIIQQKRFQEAVLTHPATCGISQKTAVRLALREAGCIVYGENALSMKGAGAAAIAIAQLLPKH